MGEKSTLGKDATKTSPYDHQLFGEGDPNEKVKGCCSGKRYVVAFIALFGFANVYALRVNLSVALVAMVSDHTVYTNGTWVMVCSFIFVIMISLQCLRYL